MEYFLYYKLVLICTILMAHRASLTTYVIILLCRSYSATEQHASHFLKRLRSCYTTIWEHSWSPSKKSLESFQAFIYLRNNLIPLFPWPHFDQIRFLMDLNLCSKNHPNLFDHSIGPKDRRENIWKKTNINRWLSVLFKFAESLVIKRKLITQEIITKEIS